MAKRGREVPEAQTSESEQVDVDFRSALLNVVEDVIALHGNLLKVKDALDSMLNIEFGKNKELRLQQIQQAMVALGGSSDLPVANNLDYINKKNSENLKKIQKLREQLALIQGKDYGSVVQRKALETRIAVAILDNSVAEKMQPILLSTTMLSGEMNNLASSKLIQASAFIDLKLKEVHELNQSAKDELKSQIGLQQPAEPDPKRPKLK